MFSSFNTQTNYQKNGYYPVPMQSQPLYRLVATVPVQTQVYHPYLHACVSVVLNYPIYELNPFYTQQQQAPQEEKFVVPPIVDGRGPQKFFSEDRPNIFFFPARKNPGQAPELANGEAYLPQDLVEELETPSEPSTRSNTPSY